MRNIRRQRQKFFTLEEFSFVPVQASAKWPIKKKHFSLTFPSPPTSVLKVKRTTTLLLSALSALSLSVPSIQAGAAPSLHVKGIAVLFYANGSYPSNSLLQSESTTAGHFISGLGANTVGLTFPFFTPGYQSNTVIAGNNPIAPGTGSTPTASQLDIVIKNMTAAKLKVVLRPIIDEQTLQSRWRGALAPTNLTSWFASYKAALTPYLTLAASDHVSGVDLAVELNSLAPNTAQWSSLVAWAKTLYSGQLIINPMARGSVGPTIPGTSEWFDFYPGLNATPTASVATLVGLWKSYAASLHLPGKPSQQTIGETGILAQTGMYRFPYLYYYTGAFNQSIQSTWYTAACQFTKQQGYNGIYFWDYVLGQPNPSSTTPDTQHPGSIQPATQSAIKACFN